MCVIRESVITPTPYSDMSFNSLCGFLSSQDMLKLFKVRLNGLNLAGLTDNLVKISHRQIVIKRFCPFCVQSVCKATFLLQRMGVEVWFGGQKSRDRFALETFSCDQS